MQLYQYSSPLYHSLEHNNATNCCTVKYVRLDYWDSFWKPRLEYKPGTSTFRLNESVVCCTLFYAFQLSCSLSEVICLVMQSVFVLFVKINRSALNETVFRNITTHTTRKVLQRTSRLSWQPLQSAILCKLGTPMVCLLYAFNAFPLSCSLFHFRFVVQ